MSPLESMMQPFLASILNQLPMERIKAAVEKMEMSYTMIKCMHDRMSIISEQLDELDRKVSALVEQSTARERRGDCATGCTSNGDRKNTLGGL